MTATLGGLSVLEATVSMPRVGLWTAQASVNTEGVIVGASALVVDEVALACAVDGDQNVGRFDARLIGGAGGMSSVLEKKAYRGCPARLLLQDALEEAGESLSSETTAVALNTVFLHWVRIRGEAGGAVALLADEMGMTWRALPDGSIWMGEESWPESNAVYKVLRQIPGRDAVELATESGLVLPGTLVDGRRVSRVEHKIKASQTRTIAWFEVGQ